MPIKVGTDTAKTRRTLKVNGSEYAYYSIPAAEAAGLGDFSKLPAALKVVLENMLRFEDSGFTVSVDDIKAFSDWAEKGGQNPREIAYRPARVIMQDFTGVPCIVDLATMREAVGDLGGDPDKVNPLAPADLVIDHSVIADLFGTARTRSSATSRSNTSATASATSSCAGARARSTTSRWCRPAPASCTRSTSSTWRGWSGSATASPIPTPAWAPTATPRWRTASACWAGASAASRPRRRCWASRCRC